MSFLIVLGLILAALFMLIFSSKKQAGVLVLALIAGASVSRLWSDSLTAFAQSTELSLPLPLLSALASALLILMPALLLLGAASTYRKKWQQLTGAAAFALLAGVLLIQPLGSFLVVEGFGRMVFAVFSDNRTYIVTAAIIFAVVDILLTGAAGRPRSIKH